MLLKYAYKFWIYARMIEVAELHSSNKERRQMRKKLLSMLFMYIRVIKNMPSNQIMFLKAAYIVLQQSRQSQKRQKSSVIS